VVSVVVTVNNCWHCLCLEFLNFLCFLRTGIYLPSGCKCTATRVHLYIHNIFQVIMWCCSHFLILFTACSLQAGKLTVTHLHTVTICKELWVTFSYFSLTFKLLPAHQTVSGLYRIFNHYIQNVSVFKLLLLPCSFTPKFSLACQPLQNVSGMMLACNDHPQVV